MAYAEVKEWHLATIEALTPSVQAARPFRRITNKATAENVAANSGGFRKFDIVPGNSRRGPTVNGHGAKQWIHDFAIAVVYPAEETDNSVLDVAEEDFNMIANALEDFRSYSFGTTGLQNVRVNGNLKLRRTGGLILQINLTATYIGTN